MSVTDAPTYHPIFGEDELRAVAREQRAAVRINGRARQRGEPCIELYDKRSPARSLLGTFASAKEAVAFLKGAN